MFLRQLVQFAIGAAGLGIASHFIGEAIPVSALRPDRFPFAPFRWERGGRIYQKVGVQKWKLWLPDKSRYVGSMVPKNLKGDHSREHMARLVIETCRAELVHVILLLLSPTFLLYLAPGYRTLFATLYGVSHFPFIIVQRYNRPRLRRLLAYYDGAASRRWQAT